MDRTDERRHTTDAEGERRERDERSRDRGILGINDANPPRDHVPGSGEKGATLDEEASERPGAREVQRSPGATGIDMGAGGTGTDIDRDI
jgi:hypothetical protein